MVLYFFNLYLLQADLSDQSTGAHKVPCWRFELPDFPRLVNSVRGEDCQMLKKLKCLDLSIKFMFCLC